MWIEARSRPQRRGTGTNWIIRIGAGHLDLRWAWHLTWETHLPRFGYRGKLTRDGWQCFVDVRPFHAKAAWHLNRKRQSLT